jgi:hypothetical protein
MLKFAILLFNTIALMMYQLFFADGITVTQKAPASAKPDTEFTIELTIKKGATSGFAKLQQELPNGFTAVEDKNNGASFTFNNQIVKFIWMSLPNDQEFKVSYKVKVAEGVVGDQTIAGKFSYVTDNTKQTSDINAVTITVSGDGSATASNTTTTTNDNTASNNDATNTNNTTTTDNTTTNNDATNTASNTTTSSGDGSFNCVRNAPATAAGEFIVELSVSKGNLNGFAKLVENLPTGFTATAIESAGATFSFTDQKVRYIWVSLPTQPEFKVSYKVKVKGISGDNLIDGVFSYIENDETKKFTVPTSSISVTEGSGAVASTKTKTKTTDTKTKTEDKYIDLSATKVTAGDGKVNYKVQILALQNPKSPSTVGRILNVSETISTEMGDNFRKYIVGSHGEYKEARDHRELIKSRGVVAPFVTAYNKGRRITVQEALMASNQSWVR